MAGRNLPCAGNDQDRIVPLVLGQRLCSLLGGPAELVVVPGADHGVGESPYLARRRQDFFVRHLLGREPR